LAELNFELADDGTFWMCLDDFMKSYNKLYVVRLYHDEVGKIWQRHVSNGIWDGETAGGCVNFPTWVNNPQFGFSAAGNAPVRVFVQLSQKDSRYSGGKATTAGFIVFSTDDNTKRTEHAYAKDVKLSPTYTNARDINHEFVAEPGKQYVVMISTFDAGEQANYSLALWSEDPINMHQLPPASNPSGKVTAIPAKALELTSGVDDDDLAQSTAKRGPPKPRVPRARPGRSAAAAVSSSSSSRTQSTSSSGDASSPYDGQLDSEGRPHGQGKYVFTNGDAYEGDFDSGSRTGKGVYRFADGGDVYTGDFVSNQFHGRGVMVYGSGDRYDGEWADGQRDGRGKFTHNNGDVFEGTYRKSQRNGPGVMRFANGDVEEGNFVNSVVTGPGKFRFADGNVYEGDFANGELTGKGALTLVTPEPGFYEGEFLNGLRHGHGEYKSQQGDHFVGEYQKNMMHKGTFKRKNGDVYVGPFDNGVPHGEGSYTVGKDGRVFKGFFDHGKLPR
jgi:hypothetical protein